MQSSLLRDCSHAATLPGDWLKAGLQRQLAGIYLA